ncbi:hypothetical protein ACHAXA_004685 [Cyclostephanos tholiformis]|uniref:Protein kinase domain-containing protein n=1 Tax=Cyclostephanos tholiformis TaxID=382380 RepID=A0ABD3R7D3_9STRA
MIPPTTMRRHGGGDARTISNISSSSSSMLMRPPFVVSSSNSHVDTVVDEVNADGAVVGGIGGIVIIEGGSEGTTDGGDGSSSSSSQRRRCVPMADWQTTSYPNCNTVHEIDMVRSSGPGSYAFPEYRRHGEYHSDRRRITAHPQVLREYLEDLRLRYPTNGRRRNAKSNAMGLMREETIEFLGQGWFRSAWEMYVEQIPGYDEDEEEWGFEESVVLKTLRIERDFLPEYYELHRRDALAMERLTFSPYVLDIYGYCGQSAINELANFGIEGMSSLEKVARSFRGMDHIEPVSKIKLQLASMVAAGVSHVHGIDYPDFPIPVEVDDDDSNDSNGGGENRAALLRDIAGGRVKVSSNATLVHYDLNPRNIAVVKRGKPKLNDFNVAELMTWDAKNNRTCGFAGRFREPWWRAPEEMHFHMPNHTDPPAPLTEKIDIYSLGNILMEILTTHSPWGLMQKGEAEDETRPKVSRGELPEWPEDFNQTKLVTDPALKAIYLAMMKCLKFNPDDRPTAGEIAAELFEAIDNLPEGFGDKEKWRREREAEDKRIEGRKGMDADEEAIGEGYINKEKWRRKKEMEGSTDMNEDYEEIGATRSALRRLDMRQRREHV